MFYNQVPLVSRCKPHPTSQQPLDRGRLACPPHNGRTVGTALGGSSGVEDCQEGPGPQRATMLLQATPHRTEGIIPERARRTGRT